MTSNDTNDTVSASAVPAKWLVPGLAAVCSVIAFVLVIWLSKTVLGQSLSIEQTVYATAMGLLGSSLFLLYNLLGLSRDETLKPEELPKNLARLWIGPVAGWLAYFMYATAVKPGPPAPELSGGTRAIAGTAEIWLPFLAGFSSDLMVGIINQGVRAIKFTLGLERMERSEPSDSRSKGNG